MCLHRAAAVLSRTGLAPPFAADRDPNWTNIPKLQNASMFTSNTLKRIRVLI
jgi:hypothetical protein